MTERARAVVVVVVGVLRVLQGTPTTALVVRPAGGGRSSGPSLPLPSSITDGPPEKRARLNSVLHALSVSAGRRPSFLHPAQGKWPVEGHVVFVCQKVELFLLV